MTNKEIVCDLQTIVDYFIEQSRGAVPMSLEEAINIIGNMPERKKGEWVRKDGIAHGIVMRVCKCSECGAKAGLTEEGFWSLSNFCPNCGADMRSEKNGAD